MVISEWEKLTEEQRIQLEKDYKDLQEWDKMKREQREVELKSCGEWLECGLDANQEKFADIISEKKRRFQELQKKYGFR